MTTADQLAIIDQWLQDESESAKVIGEAELIDQDSTRKTRLISIVEKGNTSALFVFQSHNYPPESSSDLSLQVVLPIDLHFRCAIEPSDNSQNNIILKIEGAGHIKLIFDMLPGLHTQNLVGEIFRLTEVNESTKYLQGLSLDGNMPWIHKYDDTKDGNEPSTIKEDLPSFLSPELNINRRDIAMGKTPIDINKRESIVHHEMSLKEDKFTDLREFTIFSGTWNVNDQLPPTDGSMSDWLAGDIEPPDIYVVGFQELDLSKEAFVFNECPKEDIWDDAVTSTLNSNAKFTKVKLVRLVGIMIIVYIKEEYYKYVSNVSAETVGTGIMGKLGNKGGVSIRLDFHNTSICFVNSHLAAFTNQTERRNQDFHSIMDRTLFSLKQSSITINEHDMIYWIGDLNYRINDSDIDSYYVRELLKVPKNNLKVLLEKDQLLQQMTLKKVFVDFKEGEILFPPTYKYDLGTDDWDTSEKARTPSWTDRVLWRGNNISQKRYSSHMSCRISDHKPVSSVFTAGIKVVDQVKYRKIYEDAMKKIDKLENEFLPQVSVDTTEIIFDTVRFHEPMSRVLVIANTGQVPVQFEFIKKLNEAAISRPWMNVKPSSGFISPGNKQDIVVEVSVDKTTASPLNLGSDKLYDILVLHLVNGKDIFVTVSGTYIRSCFGGSINALVRLTTPISELSVGKIVELEESSDSFENKSMNENYYYVPKELWFLCDLITSMSFKTEQLFLLPGVDSQIIVLRDWLDTGLPISKPKVSIHSAAEALLLFLESLREPVIPYHMHSVCMDSAHNFLLCKQLVAQLPPYHSHVFTYMCAFLKEVIHYSPYNGMDPKILTALFASIFLRDPPRSSKEMNIKGHVTQKLLDDKKTKFLNHFLTNNTCE
ncbi:inositol polyphosphate 5-phosphatase OCRL [Lepeophtheirus salmonis]|uniref:inositol polyphosphate 5-phosphatase OCRL n=1 Tax=Lepeophtheirus salmonis TaxID=72036 RepID=UPI001AEAA19B|nr:inositol polyphosphate 5-phosphatase OCRL-like [Lepeophtheirus salmonis]